VKGDYPIRVIVKMGKLREARLPTLLDIEKFTIPPGAIEECTKMETYKLKSVPPPLPTNKDRSKTGCVMVY
jgi:hypothetical protein